MLTFLFLVTATRVPKLKRAHLALDTVATHTHFELAVINCGLAVLGFADSTEYNG